VVSFTDRNRKACVLCHGSGPSHTMLLLEAGVNRIKPRSSKFEHYLVDVTPTPVLPWLVRLDNRVVGRVVMPGGVLILGIVTAADMPAFETETQVYPCIPNSQTILTAIRAGCNLSYLV